MENIDDYIYEKPIQKKLYKHYLKYLIPEDFTEEQEKINAADRERNKTTKRKAADKERDKTPKRKLAHQKIDEERDKTPKRKLAHQKIDEKRDKTPKRKLAHQKIDEERDNTPKRKLEDLIRLADMCVDLMRQNVEIYEEFQTVSNND